MKTQLAPFDQAQKNVWEVFWDNLQIPKWKMDALLVLFGNLTFKSKLSKKERASDPLYVFDLQRTINEITELTGDSEELKQIWSQNQSTIILSLTD